MKQVCAYIEPVPSPRVFRLYARRGLLGSMIDRRQ